MPEMHRGSGLEQYQQLLWCNNSSQIWSSIIKFHLLGRTSCACSGFDCVGEIDAAIYCYCSGKLGEVCVWIRRLTSQCLQCTTELIKASWRKWMGNAIWLETCYWGCLFMGCALCRPPYSPRLHLWHDFNIQQWHNIRKDKLLHVCVNLSYGVFVVVEVFLNNFGSPTFCCLYICI